VALDTSVCTCVHASHAEATDATCVDATLLQPVQQAQRLIDGGPASSTGQSTQHSTAQHSTAQRNMSGHSTATHRWWPWQHAAQHDTAHHVRVWHSTAQHAGRHCLKHNEDTNGLEGDNVTNPNLCGVLQTSQSVPTSHNQTLGTVILCPLSTLPAFFLPCVKS
jgi:hypothetical protein